jgi:hypothetical protein
MRFVHKISGTVHVSIFKRNLDLEYMYLLLVVKKCYCDAFTHLLKFI